jgi:hypothetical protein
METVLETEAPVAPPLHDDAIDMFALHDDASGVSCGCGAPGASSCACLSANDTDNLHCLPCAERESMTTDLPFQCDCCQMELPQDDVISSSIAEKISSSNTLALSSMFHLRTCTYMPLLSRLLIPCVLLFAATNALTMLTSLLKVLWLHLQLPMSPLTMIILMHRLPTWRVARSTFSAISPKTSSVSYGINALAISIPVICVQDAQAC